MVHQVYITDAEYIGDYKLLLSFNDGSQKIADLENHLDGEVFEPLKDHKKFLAFGLVNGTIEWDSETDIAPEFLYKIGQDVDDNQNPDRKELVTLEIDKDIIEWLESQADRGDRQTLLKRALHAYIKSLQRNEDDGERNAEEKQPRKA